MGEIAVPGKKYSVEEYLELSAHAREKLEYYDGKIFVMPGGTIEHNEIAGNIYFELRLLLNDEPEYRLFNSDQRIWIPLKNSYVYPDAVVICGQPIAAPEDPLSIINPLVIVEVLSKSTEEYDRGNKFEEYQSIDTFQEYILVRQDRPSVFTYHREGADLWRVAEFNGLENALLLKSIGIQLPLQRIYRNIEW